MTFMKWLSIILVCLFSYTAVAGVVVDGQSTEVSTAPGTVQDFSQVTEFLVPTNPSTPASAVSLDYFATHTGGFLSNITWGAIGGTLPLQSDLWAQLTSRYTRVEADGIFTPAAALADTTPGSEGIRSIGALGGYDLEEFFKDTALRGPSRDVPVFTYSISPLVDLTVSWTGGDVYSPEDGYYHIVAGTNELTDNSVNYAYWSMTSRYTVQWTTTRPTVASNIVLATFVTAFGMVIEYDPPEAAGDFPLNTRAGAARIAPSLITEGLNYYAVGTNLNAIIMDAGLEYHDMRVPKIHEMQDLRNPTQTIGIVTYAHTNTGVWGYAMTNVFPLGLYDNGTNVVACDAGSWYKGLFMSLPGSPMMHYVYPQIAYTSEVDAIAGYDPSLPPGYTPYVPLCTEYVFKGDDTSLRTDSTYWVDRRFQIRRPGTATVTGGGSAPTPSLTQVVIAGSSLGGILPHDAGLPTDPDQLASKQYVDSTINNINDNRAYVDIDNGNDTTAEVESSIKPFKTIQAAIDACVADGADATNRYVVIAGPGIYAEDITRKNYVALQGIDIEATVIQGTMTFPALYTDTDGAELTMMSVVQSNRPAVVINAGADEAYIGINACYLKSTYDNGQTNKSTVVISRGLAEIYGTTYCELNLVPTNGSGAVRHAQLFEHTTDVGNLGVARLAAYNPSCVINNSDDNDVLALMATHDNSDDACENTIQGGIFRVYFDDTATHSNRVILSRYRASAGRSIVSGLIGYYKFPLTNNCSVFVGAANNSTVDGSGPTIRDTHIRLSNLSTNIYWGDSVTTNDRLKIMNVNFGGYVTALNIDRYTNSGALGTFTINAPLANGDYYFGGALELDSLNTTTVTTPNVGHIKIFVNPYAGFENFYMKDSSGNIMRGFRDNFYNGYNDDTTTMNVGDPVYISAGLSADSTPKVKKSMARDPSTMPAVGIISSIGGATTGRVGRVMIMGRLENPTDTSAFTSGQKLYVGIDGGVTNVAPTGTNICQMIGTCHKAATNGYINVRVWAPDTIGTMTPSTIDAHTLQGLSPEQLIAQQQTYYIWGSLPGAFPSSRLVQLANPSAQPARTNTYNSVTNNMRFSGLCIATNENPRILTKGVVAIHTTTSRTGDSSPRTLKGRVRIFESDATTLVGTYWSTNTQTATPCLTNINENIIFVEIPVDTPVADLDRIILADTLSDTGWTGTESISFLSQDGYLSRLVIPAASAGIYAPLHTVTALEVRTNDWNTAYTWININSNTLATTTYVTSRGYLTGTTGSNLFYAVSNPSSYVDQTVTNGLASATYVTSRGYLTGTTGSNLFYSVSNPNSYVDQTVTNGLASATYVTSRGYLTGTTGSNLFYSVSNPSSYVDQTVTNGLASASYVTSRGYLTGTTGSNLFYSVSNPNSYVDQTVTNGLASATYVTSRGYITNGQSVTLTGTFSGDGTGLTGVVATVTSCEQSIGTGKTQAFTSSGVIVTNWGVSKAHANFTTSHSNITITAAGNYVVSSFGSWVVQTGDLRGVLYTNGVAAVDGAGNAISWRCNNQNNGVYVSFGVSRNISLSAGTKLDWRITSVANETVTWDSVNWSIEKQ